MSKIITVYERLNAAYEKSTIRLLRSSWSQIAIAIFIDSFPDRTKGIQAELLHARVDAYLEELAQAGIEIPKREKGERDITGRELCVQYWMKGNHWLASYPLETGEIEYRLTSSAIEAIETVEKLGSTDILLSSPRVEMIVKAIENAALMVSPDYEAGLTLRKAQLERAQQELDDYIAHGGPRETSDSTIRASVASIMDLLRQVPSDMRKVEEMLIDQGNQLLDDFRNDERPPGEIVGSYLERNKNIFTATESGRVYGGALETLRDSTMSETIADDLKLISQAPALKDMPAEERQDVRRAWEPVRLGVERILNQRHKSSRTIKNSLTQHDILKDRELSQELKTLERFAWEWARTCKRYAVGPLELETGKAETESLARTPYDPDGYRPPPPLVEHGAEYDTLDLQELLWRGGPMTKKVLRELREILPDDGEIDVSTLFNELDEDLRREVELCGLMQVATDLGIDVEHVSPTLYRTVSLKREERLWKAPRLKLTPEQRKALEAWGGEQQ